MALPGPGTTTTSARSPNAAVHVHVHELQKGTAENRSTGLEAPRSLEVTVGFYLSRYAGGQVSVPLDRPLRDVEITSW